MRGSHSLCNTGLRRNDGEYRWISDQGVPRHDAQGGFAGYIGSCVDVTELMNKGRGFATKSRSECVLAAEAVNLGIWEWDLRHKMRFGATTARARCFNWIAETPGDTSRLKIAFIRRLHRDDRDRSDTSITMPFRNRQRIRNRVSIVFYRTESALDVNARQRPALTMRKAARLIGNQHRHNAAQTR